VSRLVAAALIALVALGGLGSVSPASAATIQWPAQGVGDRGTDIVMIQHLLRARGAPTLPVTGYFGAMTRSAVVAFQQRTGLTASGIVDGATWSRLVISVRYDRRGEAVRAVQVALNEKRGAGLPVTGWFGPMTRTAVVAFQRGHGLTADGIVGSTTWRALAGHFEQPAFSAPSLCAYPTGANAHRAHWGTASAIASVELAARTVHGAGHGPVAVGDISLEHGGDIAGHVTHEAGLDVDIRPMRKANNQCSSGTTWYRWESGRKVCCNAAYDRAATRDLIRALRAAGGARLDVIALNDPQLIKEGLTMYLAGHDDHLHASFCQARHADRRYTC
jgi:hypothetical protein